MQSQASDKLSVVASIRPLQLIANEIMAGAGDAQVLIGQNESPHHFQLKPSQLKAVSQSDLLIWISDDFETALGKLQQNLPAGSQRLQLSRAMPDSSLIGDHDDIDGHIWLSPQNVILISQLITEQLSRLNPQHTSLYQNNLQQLTAATQKWQHETRNKLQAVKPRYITEHQFLTYFEHSFDLPYAISLRSNHDHGSGIRHLTELHDLLQSDPVTCMLVSSLPLSRQVQQLSQRFQLKVKVIYTLNENNQHNSIISLLDTIVDSLEDCR